MTIQFGTSGWRAVIADEFTFAGVGRYRRASAPTSVPKKKRPRRDGASVTTPVFLGERLPANARHVTANNLQLCFCGWPGSTPTLSHAIRTRNAVCGTISRLRTIP